MIPTPKSVCVYCGSRKGLLPSYAEDARLLGAALAGAGVRLVYGGGAIGLMGEVASAVIGHGGKVTGVIPSFLREREIEFRDADDLIITEDMHERKRIMFDRSDAFVALPGGIGTLEELIEVSTWMQLDRHKKPIIVANLENFWSPLKDLLDHMVVQGFVDPETLEEIQVASSIDEVLQQLGIRG